MFVKLHPITVTGTCFPTFLWPYPSPATASSTRRTSSSPTCRASAAPIHDSKMWASMGLFEELLRASCPPSIWGTAECQFDLRRNAWFIFGITSRKYPVTDILLATFTSYIPIHQNTVARTCLDYVQSYLVTSHASLFVSSSLLHFRDVPSPLAP